MIHRACVAFTLLAFTTSVVDAQQDNVDSTGSVIFIHPDGASAATWAAARALFHGPDSDLHWDTLPAIALYRGHMADSLSATSNGGATTHAFGVKVASDAYGRSAGGERGTDLIDEQGNSTSVALQAIRVGIPVGLVQSGIAPEPGTGCFVAPATTRRDYEGIAAKLIESEADVLLSGGEQYFLPKGTEGVHGPGSRTDGRDLIDEARRTGYTVVRTRDELLSLSPGTERVLGLFAHSATFNAQTEETLAERGLPLFDPNAPTVAEMTEAAINILSHNERSFLLVVEEEGTDNFGNKNNAAGVLEAARRADEAIGVAQRHLRTDPNTLIITTADSDGGGLRMVGIPVTPDRTVPDTLAERDPNGAPIDGTEGTGSAPFLAAPDRAGMRLPFYVVWSARDDVAGGVLVRAEGLNSDLVRGSFDNTLIAEIMRRTLFGDPRGPSDD
ncbi:MAG: alkaline phosphatase [Planctomycetota bacterium]